MSTLSTHDRYIHLQIMVNKFKDEAGINQEISFHYSEVLNRIDKHINHAIDCAMDDINQTKNLIR